MTSMPIAAAVLAAFAAASLPALADPRIRQVSFNPDSVVTVATKPGVTTLIQFGPEERVRSVATGQGADCGQALDPWCVTWPANASFVFVRPRSRAHLALALTVVTDRHAYSLLFEPLPAGETRPAVFRLSFTYPTTRAEAAARQDDGPPARSSAARPMPLVSSEELVASRLKTEPLPVNSDYSIAFGAASAELQPAAVFDDGRFTYVKWSGNREVPAVFEIRTDGSEMVANTRMQGDLIVVDRIARGLMLRSGSAVASIRNEAFDPDGLVPVGGTTAPGVERVLKE